MRAAGVCSEGALILLSRQSFNWMSKEDLKDIYHFKQSFHEVRSLTETSSFDWWGAGSFMKHFQNATSKKRNHPSILFCLSFQGRAKKKIAHDKMFILFLNVPVRVTWTLLVAFVVLRWWTLPVLVTSSHLLCRPTKMSNLMTVLTA